MKKLFNARAPRAAVLLVILLLSVTGCDQTTPPSNTEAQQPAYNPMPWRQVKMSRPLADVQAQAKAMALHRPQMPLADKTPNLRPLYAEILQLIAAGLYKEALPKLTPLAEQGYADAQYELGLLYDKKNAGPEELEDDRIGFEWLLRSAEQGFIRSQFVLGIKYFRGNNHIPRDWGKSAEWLLIAAEQGDAIAQDALSLTYTEGEGVEKDPIEAYIWQLLAIKRAENSTSVGPKFRQMESALGYIIDEFQLTEAQIRDAERRAEQWEASHPWAYQSYDEVFLVRTAADEYPAEPRVQALIEAKAKAYREEIDAILARDSQR